MKRLLSDIWDGIRFQPGRTALSFFAIGIGMISLTVLLAVLGGLRERSRTLIREMGAHVFAIMPESSTTPSLTNEIVESHASLLAANFPECRISAMRRFKTEIPGIDGSVQIVASDENMMDVRQWYLVKGRFIDTRDINKFERNAIITTRMSYYRGWDIGQVVSIKNEPFTIVGIVSPGTETIEPEGSNSSFSTGDKTILVPLSTAKLWLSPTQSDYFNLDAIFIRVSETANFRRTFSSIQRVLSGPYSKAERFTWITPEVLLSGVKRMQAAIGFTVGSVAFLCIVLGGTTLMSLMVANVRDRITEIGLRRSLGATPYDIAILFILEACIVTASASLTGTMITHLLLLLIKQYLPAPIHLDMWTFCLPFAVSLLLGILFSYGPARMAAAISPSEALRND
ncbi:MAG: hypothetical protein A2283_02600 [Lentisphaerae bacterium RIFOXYA12_FULL_48_11]|nr:MAG: hypothetical protein A2283_02600 [Lentisphaerae bacterium RIFOXYA12_FULL_48_11]